MRQLAAEAEALQQRATLALRLAHLRMRCPASGQGSSDEGRGAGGGGGGGGAIKAEHGMEGVVPAAVAATEVPQQQHQQHQQQQPVAQQHCPEARHARLEMVQYGQELLEHQGRADMQADNWEPEGLGRPQHPQQPHLEEQEWERDQKAEGTAVPPLTPAGTGDVAGCSGTHAAGSTTADMLGSGEAPSSGALPASALPEPVHVALQLVVLAAAVLEAALLWGARIGERASGGVLHVPPTLLRAPPAVLRASVMVAAVLLELLACLVHVLCGQPSA